MKRLHRICVERLKNLIREANKTCALLDSMASFPISQGTWSQAISQRVAENDAQALYQMAREELFEALRP